MLAAHINPLCCCIEAWENTQQSPLMSELLCCRATDIPSSDLSSFKSDGGKCRDGRDRQGSYSCEWCESLHSNVLIRVGEVV